MGDVEVGVCFHGENAVGWAVGYSDCVVDACYVSFGFEQGDCDFAWAAGG